MSLAYVRTFFLLLGTCPSLTAPNNGMISCSLGSDGVPNPEDTCTYTCDVGYMLTNNVETRTCQNDESWSGSVAVCSRGK